MATKQESIWYKMLCVVLCGIFCGALTSSLAMTAYDLWKANYFYSGEYYNGNQVTAYGTDYLAGSSEAHELRYHAAWLYAYEQRLAQGDTLNSEEQARMKQYRKELAPKNSNFRYRILDLDGNVLQDYSDGTLETAVSRRYTTMLVKDGSSEELDFFPERTDTSDGDFDIDTYSYYYDEQKDIYVTYDSEDVYDSLLTCWEELSETTDEDFYADYYQEETAADVEIAVPATDTATDNGEKDGEEALPATGNGSREVGYRVYTGSSGTERSKYIINEAGTKINIWESGLEDYFTVKNGWVYPPEDTRDQIVAVIEWGVADGTPMSDSLSQLAERRKTAEAHLPWEIALSVLGLVGTLVTLGILLWGTGHKEGVEGIYLTPLHRVPADLLLAVEICVFGFGALIWIVWAKAVVEKVYDGIFSCGVMIAWFGASGAVMLWLALPLLTTVTAQSKAKCIWRRSFFGNLWRIFCKICLGIYRGLREFLRHIRLRWKLAALYAAWFGLVLVFAVYAFSYYDFLAMGGAVMLAVCGVGGLAALLWWEAGWHRAREAAKKLTAGDLHYQSDTSHVPVDIKDHLTDLNSISVGMQKAVTQQLRSDRFRAELITNVSHDLKTPLTSIISYVDLLKKRPLDDPQALEYIEVLDRKSQRLKTLTEDLVEASKASTGVLPVSMEQLDAALVVQQAMGEYEEKLAAAQLRPVVSLPEGQALIRADGRHLWRILDNLLNNCVKYALPGTRVYLTVEKEPESVTISVKNISAEPLNIPAEELMERFVRGDSSRTNEGSGLGLSIAQSLAQLQGAAFRVSVDGDLFKAELQYPAV